MRASASGTDRLTIARLARTGRAGVITVARAAGGLSLALPWEAEPGRPMVAEDPWVLAREAFSPCYIGGWSAAEHWGLTEQLFRSTLVVTAAHIRERSTKLLGHAFRLFRVPRSRIAGVALVWRGNERVPVSDRGSNPV